MIFSANDRIFTIIFASNLGKKAGAAILFAIGMPVRNAMELTELCEKSIGILKKQLREKFVSDLMIIKSGSRRRGNLLASRFIKFMRCVFIGGML